MQLTTPVNYFDPKQCQITYENALFFLGSCFSLEIGSYMKKAGFQTMINPFGVIYNPLSIARCLERLLDGEEYTEKELFEYDGLFHSFDHHGSFSHESEAKILEQINSCLDDGRKSLLTADRLFLTWGTAFVYNNIKDDRVVANCHKLPESFFRREMVSVDELLSVWTPLIERLLALSPDREIILTVSPIRHLRDGAVGNQQSKATLVLFCKALLERFSDRLHYFPAYEIMMDELRDYRYYADDMTHPSSLAISIIREYFVERYVPPKYKEAISSCIKLRQRLEHKSFHPNSPQSMLFESQTETLMNALLRKYPGMVINDN